MIIKTLSLDFIITSVSLCHCVSTKLFVEHLFSEYLFVPFDLFWQQKQPPELFYEKVLKNFTNFAGKHLCWIPFLIKLLA